MFQGFGVISRNKKLLANNEIVAAAKWHGRTPTQLLLRSAVQSGISVVVTSSNEEHAVENLKINFELAPREVDAIQRIGMEVALAKGTGGPDPVKLRLWNSLEEPVNIFWKGPDSQEQLSYQLPGNMSEEDAGKSVANTFHSHHYMFRSAWFGQALINSWVADATLGDVQTVKISREVEITITNSMSEQITVYKKT